MTIDDLISSTTAQLRAAETAHDEHLTHARTVVDTAKRAGRTGLTDAERADADAALERAEPLKARIAELRGKRAEYIKIRDEDAEVDRRMNTIDPNPPAGSVARRPSYDQVARVGAEQRTYHPGMDRRGGRFLADVALAAVGDYGAADRLARHAREEQVERGHLTTRAVGTGAFTGLVVPQYLTDMYAPSTSTRRPFADACARHVLPPDGMSVNISRITTASSVALQSPENSAVSETNIDDTLLTAAVQTAAGQQTISRQALERGTGIEDIALADLFNGYQACLDSTLINQATTGLSAVATSITYTDASPTGTELYPKILAAQASVDAALLGYGAPDLAVMHSRRWAWLQSQLTSTWPLISQPNIPAQSAGTSLGGRYGSGVRGVLPNGMTVIVDNNIAVDHGTGDNEDEIYVVSSEECHLWESPDAPVMIRAEQPAASSLGVLIVLYGYFAATFSRFTGAAAKITGTGLITPSM